MREQHLLTENPDTLDTHPLVREYFGHRLATQYPDAWQQAHRSLYEYYQAVPDKQQPDTLSHCLLLSFMLVRLDSINVRIGKLREKYLIAHPEGLLSM